MMIPPVIRMGPPPGPDKMRNSRQGLVVLIAKRGWFIVKWDRQRRWLVDQDKAARYAAINPNDVVCWMPEDGS